MVPSDKARRLRAVSNKPIGERARGVRAYITTGSVGGGGGRQPSRGGREGRLPLYYRARVPCDVVQQGRSWCAALHRYVAAATASSVNLNTKRILPPSLVTLTGPSIRTPQQPCYTVLDRSLSCEHTHTDTCTRKTKYYICVRVIWQTAG